MAPSIPPTSPPAIPQQAGAPTLQLLLPQHDTSGIQEDLGTSHPVALTYLSTGHLPGGLWLLSSTREEKGRGEKAAFLFEAPKLGGGSLILGTWHCLSE